MAIDKIYPKKLNLDDDIRLLEEGDMVHAENATLTKYGTNNTNGVLSSAYGNSAVGGANVPFGSIVIGSVSDNENQCIYFFTKGTTPSVYKYTYGAGIQLVFQSAWLNFTSVDFVKADVISGNFGQRESAETILYFTDGKNPPRKINVDRAINGDFNGLTNDQLDLALNCIKGALTYPPTFRFDSDESVDGNNLKSDSFQFATQLIYKDGEESAVSAYSALAASKYYFDEGVGEKTVFDRGQNVCVIDLKWYDNASKYKDVVKIRLLGRVGNNGNFFVIDDLPANKTLHREVYGQRKLVWSHLSGQYKFYNSVVYDYVPETTVNKLYDAVPFTATGQAIASNRLFFSDYTEFRPNGDNNGNPIRAELSPVYIGSLLNTPEFTDDFFNYPTEGNGLGEGFIDVDFLQYDWAVDGNPATSNSAIPYGANTFIRFRYKPTSASLTPDPLVIKFYDGNDSFEVGFDVDVDFGDGLTVDYQNFISQETSVGDLCTQYINFLENTSYEVTFFRSNPIFGAVISSESTSYQISDQFGISDISITATISFEVTTPDSSLQFQIKPYVSDIQLNSFSFSEVVTYYDGDWHADPEFLQDGYNFSSVNNVTGYIDIQHVEVDTGTYSSGFKWGCSHDFGVVYYDEYNRSGFVNELGSVYVKHPAERDSEEGELFAGVEISFANPGDNPWYSYAPSWAKSFQIVYTGRTSYSDFLTYTTANAYPAKNDLGTVVNEGKIYLSLKTLDQYQEEKSALRDYSFTPGDKLRVVSYDEYDDESGTYTTMYPKANDNRIIEFDVVDVVVLSSDDNPLATGEDLEEKHKGTFLVLDHPEITSGNIVSVNDEQVNLKYDGFDWYQITGSAYPDNTTLSVTNYWGRNCIVEILSSRKSEGSRAYYEIGERHPIVAALEDRTSNHGAPITTFNGDIWWKKVACKSAKALNDGSWNTGTPQGWTYFRNYIETASINDFKPSEDWSKGRAHYVFDKAATFRRKNGITYSEAYEQDVDNLSLSSFNLSLSNFSYIDRQFGALNYIGNFNGNLVGIQDNKMSLIPIQGSIISYSEGQSGLAISTDVINKEQYASGDFGVSKKDLPSVLQKDNQIYFFDRSRNAILRYAGEQLTPITEKGVKNFFYKKFNSDSNTDVVSGYDPLIDSYFFTKKADFTISYNVGLGVWQSFHDFKPQFYAYMNDTMFTFNPHFLLPYDGDIMWSHGGLAVYPKYYGSQNGSLVVEVYSKINPSKVKTFNAISTESSTAFRAEVSSELNHLTSENENTLIDYTSFTEKEGVFYSQVYKKMDDSHKFYVGTCISSDSQEIQTDMYLGRHALPLGAYLYVEENNTLSSAILNSGNNTLTVNHYGNDTIGTAQFNDYPFSGKKVYVGGPNKVNGSHLRGRWMKIRLSSGSPNTHIYCINAHIAESKLTHTFNQ